MFDLNPDVDHLMLDHDLDDPFDRNLPGRVIRRRRTMPLVTAVGPMLALRHALGSRLIALGASIIPDERAPRVQATR